MAASEERQRWSDTLDHNRIILIKKRTRLLPDCLSQGILDHQQVAIIEGEKTNPKKDEKFVDILLTLGVDHQQKFLKLLQNHQADQSEEMSESSGATPSDVSLGYGGPQRSNSAVRETHICLRRVTRSRRYSSFWRSGKGSPKSSVYELISEIRQWHKLDAGLLDKIKELIIGPRETTSNEEARAFILLITRADILVWSDYYNDAVEMLLPSYKSRQREKHEDPLLLVAEQLEKGLTSLMQNHSKLMRLVKILLTLDSTPSVRSRCLRVLMKGTMEWEMENVGNSLSGTTDPLQWSCDFIDVLKVLTEQGAEPAWFPADDSSEGSNMHIFLRIVQSVIANEKQLFGKLLELLEVMMTPDAIDCNNVDINMRTILHALINGEKKKSIKNCTEELKEIIVLIARKNPTLLDATDNSQCTPLHMWILHFIEPLIISINVDQQTDDGQTPLPSFISCADKWVQQPEMFMEVLKLLITQSNVDLQNKEGMTPLYGFVLNADKWVNQPEMFMEVLKLLMTPSNIDLQTNEGRTPLYGLVLTADKWVNQPEMFMQVLKLLTTPSNIDLLTNKGRTPLYRLVLTADKWVNQPEMFMEVLKLLMTPSNINQQNNEGMTPLYGLVLNADKWVNQPEMFMQVLKLLITPSNINLQTNDRKTPLYRFISQADKWDDHPEKILEMIRLLRSSKNIDLTGPVTLTPFNRLMSRHEYWQNHPGAFLEVVELLRSPSNVIKQIQGINPEAIIKKMKIRLRDMIESQCKEVDKTNQRWIGEDGGKVELLNMSLNIFPNSVEGYVQVSVTEISNTNMITQKLEDAGLNDVVQHVIQLRLEPHGQHFLQSAYLQIDVSDIKLSDVQFLVFRKETDSVEAAWADITEQCAPKLREDKLVVTVDQFSILEIIQSTSTTLCSHLVRLFNGCSAPCMFFLYLKVPEEYLFVVIETLFPDNDDNPRHPTKQNFKYLGASPSNCHIIDGETLQFCYNSIEETLAELQVKLKHCEETGHKLSVPLPESSRQLQRIVVQGCSRPDKKTLCKIKVKPEMLDSMSPNNRSSANVSSQVLPSISGEPELSSIQAESVSLINQDNTEHTVSSIQAESLDDQNIGLGKYINKESRMYYLNKHRVHLINFMSIETTGLLDELIAKEIITNREKDEITARRTRAEKNEAFLEIMRTLDDEKYLTLLGAMNATQKDMVSKLTEGHWHKDGLA